MNNLDLSDKAPSTPVSLQNRDQYREPGSARPPTDAGYWMPGRADFLPIDPSTPPAAPVGMTPIGGLSPQPVVASEAAGGVEGSVERLAGARTQQRPGAVTLLRPRASGGWANRQMGPATCLL